MNEDSKSISCRLFFIWKLVPVIQISPNPGHGIFTLQIANADTCNPKLEVFNILGEVIYQNSIGGLRTEIDLSNQAKGAYFVCLHFESRTVTKMIIKQ